MLRINSEFDELKHFLFTENWPRAILSPICTTEAQKSDRAKDILSYFIGENLRGKKVLDFGCGEGHLVQEMAKQNPSLCIGYDIVKQSTAENITVNMVDVHKNAPYDIIVLYDVIDHVDNPATTMSNLKAIINNQTKIFIRAHPWCSRHGSHLYNQVNKAYIHLVFNKDEIKSLGYNPCRNHCNMSPQQYYRNLFKTNNFKQKFINIEESDIEDFFFTNTLVRKRLMDRGKETPSPDYFPEYQLKQTFVDFIISI